MSSHKAFFLATTVLVAAMAIPAAAQAADAIAVRSGTMRAGPGSDFPSVDHISKGDDLQVYGCTDSYSWCDVSDGDNRGWFPGSRIAYIRNGEQEILPDVGAAVGIGIIGFGVEEYWGAHYHNRPFYRQEHRFEGRYHGPQGVPNQNPPPFQPGANHQPQHPQPHFNQPQHNNPPHNNPQVQHPHVNQPNNNHPQPHFQQPHNNPPVQHQQPQFHNANPPVHNNPQPHVNNAPHNAPAHNAPCPDGKCH